jgi:diaminobutyrate-2-oxoglutarate transaminase
MSTQVFEALESKVRSYCRHFPVTFTRARNARLWDEEGKEYIDLFTGAGALNYGHNPEPMKRALLDYLTGDGIIHSLDLHTAAKREFLQAFERIILRERGLTYRMMFTGPTGTNAVEAAIKLARKVTGRSSIAAFTNGFHGMTLGALSATGSTAKRKGAGVPLGLVDRLPFDGYFGTDTDTLRMISRLLEDPSSGFDAPAAFLVETVQGEGGVRAASTEWLRGLAELARRHGSLLIVDDIQAGCGRTGTFFSFEPAGLQPDIVCLSKSLSGYGLPLSMLLIRPEADIWKPGEHNGTFRGHNPAFVTARAALSLWEDPGFLAGLKHRIELLESGLQRLAAELPPGRVQLRGRGLMRGLVFSSGAEATAISAEAFRRGVLIETSGGHDEVLKFLPPLTIEPELLARALEHITHAAHTVLKQRPTVATG